MIQFSVLTKDEVEAIHEATLRILSETGIILTSQAGLEILVGCGARLQDGRVLLPPDLVENEVAKSTKQVTLRGRGGSSKSLGDGKLYWHNLGGARDIYDHRHGNRRQAVLQDLRDATRLLDALEHATTITPFFTPQDVPGPLMSLAMYRHAIPYTTKSLQGPGVQTSEEVRFAVRMAETLGPPSEFLSLSVSPVSPLFFPDDMTEAIIETARQGIPFGPLPCPTAGTTAAIVLAQLVHPGLPIIYCGRLAMMEPRTGISVWGGIELGLTSAATVQVGHRYGLPVNVYGFSTNAHTLDVQNGFERALNAAIPALAGADELSGIGEMEAGVMSSFAQMVVDNELAASVHRLRRGFDVDEDALGVDVVAAVMRGSHNYLGQKHTRKYLRSGEVLVTHLAERGAWETWEREGRQGMAERAQAEAELLLSEHQPPPLSSDQERELDEIMREAQEKLVR
jgi:trimethylamine--corrinoid protein Co-methyltransferase